MWCALRAFSLVAHSFLSLCVEPLDLKCGLTKGHRAHFFSCQRSGASPQLKLSFKHSPFPPLSGFFTILGECPARWFLIDCKNKELSIEHEFCLYRADAATAKWRAGRAVFAVQWLTKRQPT